MMREIHTPSISAHAYQRFRQRYGEATIAQIDDFLLTDDVRKWLAWGAIRIFNYKGLHIVSENGVIVTLVVVQAGVSGRSLRVGGRSDG